MIEAIAGDIIGAVILGGTCIIPPVARNLARYGVKVCVLSAEICEAQFSRYVHHFLRCPPVEDEEAFVEYLLKIAKQEHLEGWVLFASNDQYLRILARNRSLLARHYVITVPSWEIVRFLYDKRLTYSLAKKAGIPIPETHRPVDLNELLSLDIDFPVVLKPAVTHRLIAAAQSKAYRADNRQELQNLYEQMCRLIGPGDVLVQEFIPGGAAALFSFAGYFKNGDLVAGLSVKRLRQYPMEFGKLSTFVEVVNNPELEKLATRLLRPIGYTGLAEVEFMWNEKHARFELLEVNARFWAWHELTIVAGLVLPSLAFADALGKRIPVGSTRDGTQLIHLLTDMYVAGQEIYLGKLTVRQYLASLRGAPTFAVLSLKDPLPFIVEAFFLLHRALHRLASGKDRVSKNK
ncbi:MAG: ATP-grasp domain-containing protein [Syntrophobacterales bacterium]|nr:ATP-grasp domain-containing protein [Syntrophobacterales bacterium]